MRTRQMLAVSLVAVVFTALIAGCGGGNEAKDDGRTTAGEPQKLTVAMSELKFEPAVLTVQTGRPVQIIVTNKGTARHDFVISGMPATGIKNAVDQHGAMTQEGMIMADTQPGREAKIAFTPTTTGEYEIYCSLIGHKDAGMKGTLRVQ